MAEIVSRHDACPDGGTCHHGCELSNCFRVGFCGPLSGVFPGDRWPFELVFDADRHLAHLDRIAERERRSHAYSPDLMAGGTDCSVCGHPYEEHPHA